MLRRMCLDLSSPRDSRLDQSWTWDTLSLPIYLPGKGASCRRGLSLAEARGRVRTGVESSESSCPYQLPGRDWPLPFPPYTDAGIRCCRIHLRSRLPGLFLNRNRRTERSFLGNQFANVLHLLEAGNALKPAHCHRRIFNRADIHTKSPAQTS